MPTYKVKSLIKQGRLDEKGRRGEPKIYKPGSKILLTEDEAWEIRHALENPPKRKEEEMLTDEEEEAEESILQNPLNPESGVDLFWKREGLTRKRPESNKTLQERTLEVRRAKTTAVQEALEANRKKNQERKPPPEAKPVVPVVTRPAPQAEKKK